MKAEHRKETVEKALEYIRRNYGRPITAGDVAQVTGYSFSSLKLFFREVAGKGVLAHLLQTRIDNAKRLLAETRSSVAEISSRTGFSDSDHFSAIFKRKVGVRPTAYRKNIAGLPADRSKDLSVWADDFKTDEILPQWRPLDGNWSQHGNCMNAEGQGDLNLGLTIPLPENCRVSFGARFNNVRELPPSHLRISVRDEDFKEMYCSFSIGIRGNAAGKMVMGTLHHQWSKKAVIRPEQWQQVVVELTDSTVSMTIDKERVFGARDPFPHSYSSRCRLVLGSWMSSFRIRRFRLEKLSIHSMVPAVRQGDFLFNEGLYDKAKGYYKRQFRSNTGDAMELCYKVGVCCYHLGDLDDSEAWLDKVPWIAENGSWGVQAHVAKMRAIWKRNGYASLASESINILNQQEIRDPLRKLLWQAQSDALHRGFHANGSVLCDRLIVLDRSIEVLANEHIVAKFDHLVQLRKYDEVEARLGELVDSQRIAEKNKLAAHWGLAHVCALQGKWDESMQSIEKARSRASSGFDMAHCDIAEFQLLRASRKSDEALRFLGSIQERCPGLSRMNWYVMAELERSLHYCALGELTEARAALAKARKIWSEHAYLQPGFQSRVSYVPLLVKGDYRSGAKLFLRDMRVTSGTPVRRANQAIKAGILTELAGDLKGARRIWLKAVKDFPADECCWYGGLAQSFAESGEDDLADMPYDAQERSEIFYLAALLHEKRGNSKYSNDLLNSSVLEDPTLRWPAWLARKKLGRRAEKPSGFRRGKWDDIPKPRKRN